MVGGCLLSVTNGNAQEKCVYRRLLLCFDTTRDSRRYKQ